MACMDCMRKAMRLLRRARGLLLLMLLRDRLDQLLLALQDDGKLLKKLFDRHGEAGEAQKRG